MVLRNARHSKRVVQDNLVQLPYTVEQNVEVQLL